MNEIYTVGYTAFAVSEFIKILKQNKILCIVDVRSSPVSTYYPDYNRGQIEKTLRQNGILYRNYATEFGARQTDAQYYINGYLSFNKFVQSKAFNDGYKKILAGIQQNYTFALMCAEKDPINCHRTIMIGREFSKRGFSVKHLMADGKIETQKDIDSRLLEMYFPNRGQLSLFGSDAVGDDNLLIERAYEQRNAEIGYKLEDE